MMLCRADFDEIFPDLFQAERAPDSRNHAGQPSAMCLARWEDDGGRIQPAGGQARTGRDHIVQPDYDLFDLARDGGMAVMLPAVAAYAAAWTALSDHARDVRSEQLRRA